MLAAIGLIAIELIGLVCVFSFAEAYADFIANAPRYPRSGVLKKLPARDDTDLCRLKREAKQRGEHIVP